MLASDRISIAVGSAGVACTLAMACPVLAQEPAAAPQYEVIPQGPPVRWNFWLQDGPAEVLSSNRSLGNRFQIGAEAHLGPEYRIIAGITAIDWTTSNERSDLVGDVSRYGFDLRVGYFLIPNRFFVEYGLYFGEVSGSAIYGWNGAIGHGAAVGVRIFSQDYFNLSLVANYQFIGSQTVTTYNVVTGATGLSTYPRANIYSLGVRAGFDVK